MSWRKRVNRKSVRIEITTADIGRLLGIKEDTVRHYISSGKIPLTGDALKDLEMLNALVRERRQS